MITFDDFQKVEIRIGKILSAEKIPETDKLLKLSVSFGKKPDSDEQEVRQIVSGISLYFPNPEELVGVKCAFVTNLEPRTIRGFESQGMILAISLPGEEGKTPVFSLFKVPEDIPEGTRAK